MSSREIREEVIVQHHPLLDRRVAYVLPVIPDGAPYRVREGIARRRIAATTGQCPCGARFDVGGAPRGEVTEVEVAHERGCPAVTETLVKACRRWVR